eukprot:7511904-Heterocapsa_arctica.AAC.1
MGLPQTVDPFYGRVHEQACLTYYITGVLQSACYDPIMRGLQMYNGTCAMYIYNHVANNHVFCHPA